MLGSATTRGTRASRRAGLGAAVEASRCRSRGMPPSGRHRSSPARRGAARRGRQGSSGAQGRRRRRPARDPSARGKVRRRPTIAPRRRGEGASALVVGIPRRHPTTRGDRRREPGLEGTPGRPFGRPPGRLGEPTHSGDVPVSASGALPGYRLRGGDGVPRGCGDALRGGRLGVKRGRCARSPPSRAATSAQAASRIADLPRAHAPKGDGWITRA
jgi:hypothetical protein